MIILKKYTKQGIEFTHPSGHVAITTLDAITRRKAYLIELIKKSTAELTDLSRDEIGITNARS